MSPQRATGSGEGSSPPGRAQRFWSGWTALVLRRPWALAALGFAAFLIGLPGSVRLYRELHTDLRELLPQGAPSAVGLEELEQRLGGLASLSVVIRTDDFEAGKRLSDALVAKLRTLPLGARVYGKTQAERDFFEAHGALYAEPGDLIGLRDRLKRELSAADRAANPLVVDLTDDDAAATPAALPETTRGELAQSLEKLRRAFRQIDHFRDAYLASEDGRTLVVSVVPREVRAGLNDNLAVMRAVEKAVAEVRPEQFHSSIRIGYAGDVRNVIEAQEALVRDLALSSVLVLLLVTGAILIFFRTLRSVPLLVLPLFTGVALTFALSRITVGYLNPNTAFLGSIIIGNGINPGIILLARWLEEKRRGLALDESLRVALRGTWAATLAASSAAAASYGTLLFVQFRGFNQFGWMGLFGMLICWAATYALMPPLIVLYERIRPLPVGAHGQPPVGRASLAFSALVTARPRAAALATLVLVAGSGLAILRFAQDPVQYDFTKLGSRQGAISGAAFWSRYVDEVMQSYQTPTVVLTDSADQAHAVQQALEAQKRRPGQPSTIARIDTLQTLLPDDQPARIALLREIFGLLSPRVLLRLEPKDRALVERVQARTRLETFDFDDLPERLSRFFKEKNGSTGRLVMVYPTLESDARHGRAQVRHGAEVREAALRAVPTARVAGQVVLTGDIITIINHDGLLAGVLSFAAVALLALLAMRSLRHAGWVLASLSVGVLWMFGVLGAFAIKFNFVNFVVLPITFGIGADYAVNLYLRYREAGSAREALAASGGAVALCSSTTIIGYAVLLVADNMAIQSFGLTAVIGELTCLSAALFALPALLAARDGRAKGAGRPAAGLIEGT